MLFRKLHWICFNVLYFFWCALIYHLQWCDFTLLTSSWVLPHVTPESVQSETAGGCWTGYVDCCTFFMCHLVAEGCMQTARLHLEWRLIHSRYTEKQLALSKRPICSLPCFRIGRNCFPWDVYTVRDFMKDFLLPEIHPRLRRWWSVYVHAHTHIQF